MMIIAVWQLFLNYRTNGVEKEATQHGQSAVMSMEDGAVKDFTAKKLEQEKTVAEMAEKERLEAEVVKSAECQCIIL